MKPKSLNHAAALVASLPLIVFANSSLAATVLYTDNFNVDDNGSLDASSQIGRNTGLLTGIRTESGALQHSISTSQLNLLQNGTNTRGHVRFANISDGARYNFASGTSGTNILAQGGFRFEFDWAAPNNTADSWISFTVGHTSAFEFQRVNDPGTDFGVLFRNTGSGTFFHNGTNMGNGTTGFNITNPTAQHHATIDLTFTSFADLTAVMAKTYVDNVLIKTSNFTWNGNGGVLNMELATITDNKRVDNIVITAVPEPSAALLGALGMLALLRHRR